MGEKEGMELRSWTFPSESWKCETKNLTQGLQLVDEQAAQFVPQCFVEAFLVSRVWLEVD